MSEPIDITEHLHRCREAARNLWNSFLRPSSSEGRKDPQTFDWDRVESFDQIRAILFREMVLKPIGQQTFARLNSHAAYPFISLIPTASPIPIMVNRAPEAWSGYWDDPVNRIGSTGTQLLFVDYFDWDKTAFRDFQYYLAHVARFEQHPHLAGRYALIEAQYVRAHYQPGS
jgi:hypothetical protein